MRPISPFVVLAAAFASACSCSQDYNFASNFGTVPAPEGDDPPGNLGTYTSLDLSPEGGRITMAYHDRNAQAVGYAIGTPGGDGEVAWVFERIEGYDSDDNDVGMYAAQRTARDGTVWVAYHDADDEVLKARHRLGGGVWDDVVTVAPGGLWAHMSMVASRPVVAHADASGTLHLSTLDDGNWSTEPIYSSAATSWTLPDGSTELRPAQIGQIRTLLDGDTLYVAVHDAAKGELHLLTGDKDAADASDFEVQVVARGDVGAWPAMIVHEGKLHIAFQDVGQQDLVLAVASGGGFELEVVDDGQMAGADSELFVDDGDLGILYFDGWEGDLRLARPDGNGWATEVVAGSGMAAGFHNETVAVGGKRYFASYDYTHHAFLFEALE